MIVEAKKAKMGKPFQNVKLKLPDSCPKAISEYTIEIVEYDKLDSLGVYFVKDETDIYSHTIHNYTFQDNVKQGFKNAINGLFEATSGSK